jgi:hypothetical protein
MLWPYSVVKKLPHNNHVTVMRQAARQAFFKHDRGENGAGGRIFDPSGPSLPQRPPSRLRDGRG